MRKIKMVFFTLIFLLFLCISFLFVMKPASDKKTTATQQTASQVIPPPPPVSTDTVTSDNVVFRAVNSSTETDEINDTAETVTGIARKKTSENPVNPAERPAAVNTPQTPADESLAKFVRLFGRNIFQEKIDLKSPELFISEYEDPDTDGRVVLFWENVPFAQNYVMEFNGETRPDVLSPYTLLNLEDGNYQIRIYAANNSGTSKWSQTVNFMVQHRVIEVVEREMIRINLQGFMKKKGSFQALIDDKLFKENDELEGGIIKSISSDTLVLEKKGYEYEFRIEGSRQ